MTICMCFIYLKEDAPEFMPSREANELFPPMSTLFLFNSLTHYRTLELQYPSNPSQLRPQQPALQFRDSAPLLDLESQPAEHQIPFPRVNVHGPAGEASIGQFYLLVRRMSGLDHLLVFGLKRQPPVRE